MNQAKKQKLPAAAVCVLFLMMAVFMCFHLNTEAAEERYTVVMKGTRSYSGAYEVLDLVNEERKKAGLEPLTMDEKLLEYAMRRAMECKLEFSHTRPDGTSFDTICTEKTACGENAHPGGDPERAVYDWMQSDGHRGNILGKEAKSIGVGCVYIGNSNVWVQIFSTEEADPVSQPADWEVKETVTVVDDGTTEMTFNRNESWLYNICEIWCGEEKELTVGRASRYSLGRYGELAPETFTWSSSNPSVISVDADGMVRAQKPGSAVITARMKSGSGRVISSTVVSAKKMDGLTISSLSDVTYNGKAFTPKPEVYDGSVKLKEDVDYVLEYFDNLHAGKATVAVKGCGSYRGTVYTGFFIESLELSDLKTVEVQNGDSTRFTDAAEFLKENVKVTYQGKTLQYETDYVFSEPKVGDDHTISYFNILFRGDYWGSRYCRNINQPELGTIADQTWTGKAVCPKLVFYGKMFNGLFIKTYEEDMEEGRDYTLSWKNNVNAGNAEVTVTGMGRYFGSVKARFKIVKKSNSGNGNSGTTDPSDNFSPAFSAKLSKTSVTYNGKAQKPKVIVKSGSKTLKSGKDYTLIYKNNKRSGIATVVVKGKGSYAKYSKKLTFSIKPAKLAAPSVKSSKKGTFTVKWKKNTEITGYQVQYSTDKAFKAGTKLQTIKKKTTLSCIIKSLKSKKTYYVRMRGYKKASGKTVYGTWSKTVRVKIQ